MKLWHLAAGAVLALINAPAAADPLPMDAPVTIGNVETVCTGIGSSKDDPRWAAYPIRVEFSNGGAQYLSGAHVKLTDKLGATLAEFDCGGAWVLFKLPKGTYAVTATINGMDLPAHSARFEPPQTGQRRVVLQFTKAQPNQ
jgi:hypothetical protein